MPEIGLAGVRTQGQGRVDGAPRNLFMVILKAVGEQNPDHVLYLLLAHKVQLQFVKEEVGDERVHSHCVLVLGESFLIVSQACLLLCFNNTHLLWCRYIIESSNTAITRNC